MIHKKRLIVVLTAFLFGSLLTGQVSAIQDAPNLSGLIGKECTMFLKNGEEISGTLWDYNNKYVTLKIKKGLLYSKAEQFPLSDIQFIEGENGRTYDVSGVAQQQSEPVRQSGQSEPPKSADSENEDKNSDLQNTLRIVTVKGEESEPDTPERVSPPPEPEKTEPEPQPEPAASETVAQNPPPAKTIEPVKTPVKRKESTPARKKSAAMAKKSKKSAPATDESESDTAASLDSDEIASLKYQNYILYGVTATLILVFLAFKVLGLRGAAYAKQSLFPARIIRINGPYGIIDQGEDDGVKVNDLVWFYRKHEKEIQFKGKARVTKVAENYSAVEIFKVKSGARLGAGDVGIRDRNLLFNLSRQVRGALSKGLAVLAQRIATTAQTLDTQQQPQNSEPTSSSLESEHETEIKEVTELAKKTRVNDQGKKQEKTETAASEST